MTILNLLDSGIGNREIQIPAVLSGGVPGSPAQFVVPAIATLIATADPTASNDVTQGISVGSIWFNSTAGQLRWWICRSNTAGAAAWVFDGADYANGGTNPPIEITAFGSGAATMAEEGNINRQVSGAGVSPTQTGQDIILQSYQLPANSFDIAGRGICITSQGSFASNGNNKRIKIFVGTNNIAPGQIVSGGTAIADTATITTNGGGWSLMANVYKYGATGSNTQLGLHQQSQVGAAVSALSAPTSLTLTENAPTNVVITGNVATNLTDLVSNFLEINAMN